jgi:DNA adenine methylase
MEVTDDIGTASAEAIGEAEAHQALKSIPKLNTPFGYFGSKNKIATQLIAELPPHNCWVEVFCGSAAVTLSKPIAPIEVLNDINHEIVNFFNQIRTNWANLKELLELTPYAREELNLARKPDENDTDSERARKFLVRSMFAINGAFGEVEGGFSYSQSYTRDHQDARVSRWNHLPERIDRVAERLKHARIESIDGLRLIKMFEKRPATLLYVDPPYLSDRVRGYDHEAHDEEFHHELLRLLMRSRCMVVISGYDNPLYRKHLTTKTGWTQKVIQTITKDTKGRAFERNELLWMNKSFVKAKESNKVPIKLTKREAAMKKVNPERKGR